MLLKGPFVAPGLTVLESETTVAVSDQSADPAYSCPGSVFGITIVTLGRRGQRVMRSKGVSPQRITQEEKRMSGSDEGKIRRSYTFCFELCMS